MTSSTHAASQITNLCCYVWYCRYYKVTKSLSDVLNNIYALQHRLKAIYLTHKQYMTV